MMIIGRTEVTEKRELLDALGELETTFRQSASLASNDLKESRKEAVQLRRVMADKLNTISSLGVSALESSGLGDAFRSEFSKMRSAIAHHHASWPIVSIDLQDPEYLASIKRMRESYTAFISWVRNVLAAGK